MSLGSNYIVKSSCNDHLFKIKLYFKKIIKSAEKAGFFTLSVILSRGIHMTLSLDMLTNSRANWIVLVSKNNNLSQKEKHSAKLWELIPTFSRN